MACRAVGTANILTHVSIDKHLEPSGNVDIRALEAGLPAAESGALHGRLAGVSLEEGGHRRTDHTQLQVRQAFDAVDHVPVAQAVEVAVSVVALIVGPAYAVQSILGGASAVMRATPVAIDLKVGGRGDRRGERNTEHSNEHA